MARCLSEVPLPDNCAVVFDLDDTLYKEREFVYSGFRAVADFIGARTGNITYERMVSLFEAGETDVFKEVLDERNLLIEKAALIRIYREHSPKLCLKPEVGRLLTELVESGHLLGIITDGRSLTQRNKIRALGLDQWIENIVISEEIGVVKPAPASFLEMQNRFAGRPLAYVGDNLAKDFLAPKRFGWTTICLRTDAINIHPQDFNDVLLEYQPDYLIDQLG